MREAIGRDVTFVTEVKTDCPTCTIDPYTGDSTDPYCLTCSGVGYLTTLSGYSVIAHITWNPSETLQWVAGGQYLNYDCRIQIEYTADNLYAVDSAEYVLVDSKKLKVNSTTFRGVKDINRIIIDLKEP